MLCKSCHLYMSAKNEKRPKSSEMKIPQIWEWFTFCQGQRSTTWLHPCFDIKHAGRNRQRNCFDGEKTDKNAVADVRRQRTQSNIHGHLCSLNKDLTSMSVTQTKDGSLYFQLFTLLGSLLFTSTPGAFGASAGTQWLTSRSHQIFPGYLHSGELIIANS